MSENAHYRPDQPQPYFEYDPSNPTPQDDESWVESREMLAYRSDSLNLDGSEDEAGVNGMHDNIHTHPGHSTKQEPKLQQTFLTKLFQLLERPENHSIIRWDPLGEHIIIEKPDELASSILPSIYRQSRFASFSRQLNIYGFMRKINLRNVDPNIDSPDASTWAHPTLNRHSPPSVVANFKRRVPPRVPRPKASQNHSNISLPSPTFPTMSESDRYHDNKLSIPTTIKTKRKSSLGLSPTEDVKAFSHTRLPPLITKTEAFPISINDSNSATNDSHSPSQLSHPITPRDDQPTSIGNIPLSCRPGVPGGNGNALSPDSSLSPHAWQFSPTVNPHAGFRTLGANTGSLRPSPTVGSYPNQFAFNTQQFREQPSPDSRPTTGYSVSSISSTPYETISRPSSSHLGFSPIVSRPSSAKSFGVQSGLNIRRKRPTGPLTSPYPTLYEERPSRPLTQGSLTGPIRSGSYESAPRPLTSGNGVDQHRPGAPWLSSSFDQEMRRPSTYDPTMALQKHLSISQPSDLDDAVKRVQGLSSDPADYSALVPEEVQFAFSAVPGAVGPTAEIQAMQMGETHDQPSVGATGDHGYEHSPFDLSQPDHHFENLGAHPLRYGASANSFFLHDSSPQTFFHQGKLGKDDDDDSKENLSSLSQQNHGGEWSGFLLSSSIHSSSSIPSLSDSPFSSSPQAITSSPEHSFATTSSSVHSFSSGHFNDHSFVNPH